MPGDPFEKPSDPFEKYMGVPPPSNEELFRLLGLSQTKPISKEDLAQLTEDMRAAEVERMRLSLTLPEKSVVQKIEEANTWIRKIIADGKLSKDVQVRWAARVREALKPLYGEKGPLVETLESWRKELTKNLLATNEFVSRVKQVDHLLSLLQGSGSLPSTKDVFIIHGHDELNRRRLSQMITDDFKLKPKLILDEAGRSAPTIVKFEEHAQTCSFAIALFTRDDNITPEEGEVYYQARPNVTFETGWFVGRLGKERVLILLHEGVKIYSDFDGVSQIQFRDDVREKFSNIKKELEAAGLI